MQNAVLITGAQSGTGYGIAQQFAKMGWDVFLTSRRGPDAEQAAKNLAQTYGVFAKGYACNIRNEQQVIDMFRDIDSTGRFVETVVLNAANMGFDAIAVSLLGNSNPVGILASSFLITVISKGSTYMSSKAGLDAEIASVITGLILLFSASCSLLLFTKY